MPLAATITLHFNDYFLLHYDPPYFVTIISMTFSASVHLLTASKGHPSHLQLSQCCLTSKYSSLMLIVKTYSLLLLMLRGVQGVWLGQARRQGRRKNTEFRPGMGILWSDHIDRLFWHRYTHFCIALVRRTGSRWVRVAFRLPDNALFTPPFQFLVRDKP